MREALSLYDARMDGRNEGFALGEKRGISIGKQQGILEKAIEAAKNFLSMGFSAEQVAKGTGLPIEQVRQLAK